MPSNTLEVLDANIVLVPETPLTQTVQVASLFEEGELASLIRKPVTITQGLSFDVTLGTSIGMYQFESMRSQKTITLSSLRVEVHDRSGEPDLEKAQIPETLMELATALHIGPIKAIGANWEITFKLSELASASTAIADKLLLKDTGFLPKNFTSIGGAVRLFLSDHSGLEYTLAIEPRGQNIRTDALWMSCNANVANPETLSLELLKAMFQHSYHLLFEVKKSLFSASQL